MKKGIEKEDKTERERRGGRGKMRRERRIQRRGADNSVGCGKERATMGKGTMKKK